MDKKLLAKLIFFAVMVIVGLLVWLVVTNVLMPPKVTVDRDLTALTRVMIDPELETASIDLMRDKRRFEPGELDTFAIYLDDSDADPDSEDLLIKRSAPIEPLDLGYYLLSGDQETAQAELAARQPEN